MLHLCSHLNIAQKLLSVCRLCNPHVLLLCCCPCPSPCPAPAPCCPLCFHCPRPRSRPRPRPLQCICRCVCWLMLNASSFVCCMFAFDPPSSTCQAPRIAILTPLNPMVGNIAFVTSYLSPVISNCKLQIACLHEHLTIEVCMVIPQNAANTATSGPCSYTWPSPHSSSALACFIFTAAT